MFFFVIFHPHIGHWRSCSNFPSNCRQYGAGTEVPIKSLLGHRSQAPPEVRHISGQHVKEFKDFLARYPEEFVVKEEIVYLREYEGKITTTFRKTWDRSINVWYLTIGPLCDLVQILILHKIFIMNVYPRECEEYKIDPIVTNQFLTFFRETVDQKGPLHVDQLFDMVTNHFNINLWSTIFKTPQVHRKFSNSSKKTT